MTGRALIAGTLLMLLAGCAGGVYSIPHPIADAEPIPTRCPNYVPGCGNPQPTHSTPPPEAEETASATPGGGGPKPRKTQTSKPGTTPNTGPSVLPTTIPGVGGAGPKPPAGSRFVAFTFAAQPFEQAYPLDPPPPPPPLKESLPTPLVSLAGVLAAGVAASAGIASRRRGPLAV